MITTAKTQNVPACNHDRRCQGNDTSVAFQPIAIFRFWTLWRNGELTFSKDVYSPSIFLNRHTVHVHLLYPVKSSVLHWRPGLSRFYPRVQRSNTEDCEKSNYKWMKGERRGVQPLTCSRPPVSPVLFKWLVNSLPGESHESRANNSIANMGTSCPWLILLCSWTATSNIRSFVASRILNSSVSLLSRDSVESILSDWLELSHILRIYKTTHVF